jgi:hypothetical protein
MKGFVEKELIRGKNGQNNLWSFRWQMPVANTVQNAAVKRKDWVLFSQNIHKSL